MKIERNELDKVIKILNKNVIYEPTVETSIIFFPIETSRIEESDGFEFNIENKGADKTVVIPGLTLEVVKTEKEEYSTVRLAYADITYSPKFDFLQFLDFYGKFSKKDMEALAGLECYIVNKSYVSAIYKL